MLALYRSSCWRCRCWSCCCILRCCGLWWSGGRQTLCWGKGGTSGSSVSAVNLPGCPLAANKSCWSAASLGASLRTDLAVKAPCLVKMMCISAKLSRPAQMPIPPLLLELEHMRSWFSPEHCLKNGDDDTRIISDHLPLERCLLVLPLHHEPIMQPRTMSDEPCHCRVVRWQGYTVPLHHIVSPSTHQSLWGRMEAFHTPVRWFVLER